MHIYSLENLIVRKEWEIGKGLKGRRKPSVPRENDKIGGT